ncbi:hypothetical protein GCM10010531_25020 [Blastococcus jejuensis]|uniref:PEP-CTERM protein-sorting domain-containing protein n=1 Tax=Blastococcus jejuensis TaxID=351224 RepID=A0ABP6PDA5_9ACTN
MTFPLLLLVLGGFLLGGAWSVWKLDTDERARSTGQTVIAVALLVCALLATASGILRFF